MMKLNFRRSINIRSGKSECKSVCFFKGSALFDSMSVEDNIRFPLDMFTNKTRKEKDTQGQLLSRTG